MGCGDLILTTSCRAHTDPKPGSRYKKQEEGIQVAAFYELGALRYERPPL